MRQTIMSKKLYILILCTLMATTPAVQALSIPKSISSLFKNQILNTIGALGIGALLVAFAVREYQKSKKDDIPLIKNQDSFSLKTQKKNAKSNPLSEDTKDVLPKLEDLTLDKLRADRHISLDNIFGVVTPIFEIEEIKEEGSVQTDYNPVATPSTKLENKKLEISTEDNLDEDPKTPEKPSEQASPSSKLSKFIPKFLKTKKKADVKPEKEEPSREIVIDEDGDCFILIPLEDDTPAATPREGTNHSSNEDSKNDDEKITINDDFSTLFEKAREEINAEKTSTSQNKRDFAALETDGRDQPKKSKFRKLFTKKPKSDTNNPESYINYSNDTVIITDTNNNSSNNLLIENSRTKRPKTIAEMLSDPDINPDAIKTALSKTNGSGTMVMRNQNKTAQENSALKIVGSLYDGPGDEKLEKEEVALLKQLERFKNGITSPLSNNTKTFENSWARSMDGWKAHSKPVGDTTMGREESEEFKKLNALSAQTSTNPKDTEEK